MNNENITEYMAHVNVINKDLSEYVNEEKGVKYIIPTPHLIVRIEYKELTESELQQAKFGQQIDKNVEYNTKMTTRPRPKYEITKNEADKFTLIESKVKVYEVWNVINGLNVKTSFNNKDEALKLYDEVNKPILELLK